MNKDKRWSQKVFKGIKQFIGFFKKWKNLPDLPLESKRQHETTTASEQKGIVERLLKNTNTHPNRVKRDLLSFAFLRQPSISVIIITLNIQDFYKTYL